MAECMRKLPLGMWEWERLQMCEIHAQCVRVENSVTIDTDIDTDTDINKTPMVCGLTADNDNRVYW